jgi:hypothetical protein
MRLKSIKDQKSSSFLQALRFFMDLTIFLQQINSAANFFLYLFMFPSFRRTFCCFSQKDSHSESATQNKVTSKDRETVVAIIPESPALPHASPFLPPSDKETNV